MTIRRTAHAKGFRFRLYRRDLPLRSLTSGWTNSMGRITLIRIQILSNLHLKFEGNAIPPYADGADLVVLVGSCRHAVVVTSILPFQSPSATTRMWTPPAVQEGIRTTRDMRSGTVVCPASQVRHACAAGPYGVRGSDPNRSSGMLDSPACRVGFSDLSLPFIPSCLPTTARLSGTDIILSQWLL